MSQSDLPRTVILYFHKSSLALGGYCRTGIEHVQTQWQLEGYLRGYVYQQQLYAKDPLLLKIGEGQNRKQGTHSKTGNSQALVYLIILICQTNQQEGGAHTNTCICSTEGRCPQPWACMYLLWNQASQRMHKYHGTARLGWMGRGGVNHRPQGTMLQKAVGGIKHRA